MTDIFMNVTKKLANLLVSPNQSRFFDDSMNMENANEMMMGGGL